MHSTSIDISEQGAADLHVRKGQDVQAIRRPNCFDTAQSTLIDPAGELLGDKRISHSLAAALATEKQHTGIWGPLQRLRERKRK